MDASHAELTGVADKQRIHDFLPRVTVVTSVAPLGLVRAVPRRGGGLVVEGVGVAVRLTAPWQPVQPWKGTRWA